MIAIGKSYLKCAAVAYGWRAADVKGGLAQMGGAQRVGWDFGADGRVVASCCAGVFNADGLYARDFGAKGREGAKGWGDWAQVGCVWLGVLTQRGIRRKGVLGDWA